MILCFDFSESSFFFFFFFLRQQVFTAFTKEVLAAPFTEQVFRFVIPALADAQTLFPYEPFLNALVSAERRGPEASAGAPWLFYFVLTVGENYLGMKYKMRCIHIKAVLADKSGEGVRGGCRRPGGLWGGILARAL